MVKVPEGYRSRNVQDRRTGGSAQRGGADLLGGMLGGNATGGGLLATIGKAALPMILGSIMGGRSSGGGLGGLLGSMLGGGSKPQMSAVERDEADDQATLLLRAMVNAAKADGQVDKEEIDNIVKRLGEVDEHEAAFLKAELQAPLDVEGYCRSVPDELTQQAYAFSVMGMRLDTQQEAQYLGAMAQGLRLNPEICNSIHEKLGIPPIFK